MGVQVIEQLQLGEERKEAGQRLALSYSEEWAESVVRFVLSLPTGHEIDAEYIRSVCGSPPSSNAMGGVFSRLVKQGFLQKMGWKKAHRASRHAAEIRYYEVR